MKSLLALLALGGLALGGAAQQAPAPDLCVAFISLTPRYPAYEVEYPDGLPQSLDPDTGKPLALEDAERVRRWPRAGEAMTAAGRVVNHGAAPSGPFAYTWLLDGKPAATARHPGLAAPGVALPETREWKLKGATLRETPLRPETFADLTFSFPWKSKGRRLELRVQPDSAGDANPENNRRAESTEALPIAVLVHRSVYNSRTTGFEDWVQAQFQALRERLESAAAPSSLGGVEQPLRIDTVRVLADDQDLAVFRPVQSVNGWDASLLFPFRAGAPDAVSEALLPQLGLVPRRAWEIDPDRNEVRHAGARIRIGYAMPGPVPGSFLTEHEAMALNRMRGRRRGYRGAYLFDLPRACRVRVLDNNGRPVSDAMVAVFQADAGSVAADPVAKGATNIDGAFLLPNRPAPAVRTEIGFALRDNPFGALRATGDNGLLLLQISARAQVEHQWLPVGALNLAYWRGQTAQATFDLRTHIAPVSAPMAPTGVACSSVAGTDPPALAITWAARGGADVAGYFVYRAAAPTFRWERLGGVTAGRRRYVDSPIAELRDVELRYSVTAVDVQGNESALSRPISAPRSPGAN